MGLEGHSPELRSQILTLGERDILRGRPVRSDGPRNLAIGQGTGERFSKEGSLCGQLCLLTGAKLNTAGQRLT